MNKDLVAKSANAIIQRFPDVYLFLSQKARSMIDNPYFKSFEYYHDTIVRLVKMVYSGLMAGEFLNILPNLIHGQLSDAYETCLTDNGLGFDEASPAMRESLQNMIAEEQSHVEDFYRAIVDARLDNAPIDGLLNRAELWANRYNDAYNQAQVIITLEKGGKLRWLLGETEQHCATCAALNGMVMFASEWEVSGLRPQNPPNDLLECGGWQCDCSIEPTTDRRSPRALERVLDMVVRL